MDDALKQKRFLWGVALAWAPWVPTLIGLRSVFTGISNTKATGLAALAGGFAEMYVMVGLVATVICEVSATVLLFRAFSAGHGVRSAFSALSICMSALMLLLFCLSLWLLWFASHHRF
jgi:hypothetical protein